MEEVIHLESNQLIKSLLQVQSDIFKGYSNSLDRSNGIDIEKKLDFKVNLYNLEGLILYFQNGFSHQLSFSKTERLKNLFEFLLKKEDSKLLNYLKSISFSLSLINSEYTFDKLSFLNRSSSKNSNLTLLSLLSESKNF